MGDVEEVGVEDLPVRSVCNLRYVEWQDKGHSCGWSLENIADAGPTSSLVPLSGQHVPQSIINGHGDNEESGELETSGVNVGGVGRLTEITVDNGAEVSVRPRS